MAAYHAYAGLASDPGRTVTSLRTLLTHLLLLIYTTILPVADANAADSSFADGEIV